MARGDNIGTFMEQVLDGDGVVIGHRLPVSVSGVTLELGQDSGIATEATLDAIKTAIQILDDIVSGNEAQVDVLSLPSLPAGTNAIGKLAANSGVDIGDVDILSIAAGDNNIGNVDIASAIPAGTNLIGKISAGTDTTNLYDGATALTPTFLAIAKNSSGDNELVAADATKKIRVLSLALYVVGTTISVYFKSASTAIFGGASAALPLDKTGAAGPAGLILPYNPLGWFQTSANEALNLNLSGAQYVGGSLVYVKV